MSVYTPNTNFRAQGSPRSYNEPIQEFQTQVQVQEYYTGGDYCNYNYEQVQEQQVPEGWLLAPIPVFLAAKNSQFATMDDVMYHYHILTLEREVATAKWATETAHLKAQADAAFMQSLPKFSRGMLIKLEGPKAYERRLAIEARQAALQQAEAERKAAWGKPRDSTNKFGHRRNGGGKRKKIPMETDEVRRVDRDGLPVGWTVATVMAKRVAQKQALKAADVKVKVTPKVVVQEAGLPEGWRKRTNAHGRTFYISPSGDPQWHLPGTKAPVEPVKAKVVEEAELTDEQRAARDELTAMRVKLAALVLNKPAVEEIAVVTKAKEVVVKAKEVVVKAKVAEPVFTMGAQCWGAAREGEIRSQVRINGKPCNSICAGKECERGHSCCFAHKAEEIKYDRCSCNHGEACKRFRWGKCPFYHEGREDKQTFLRRIGMIKRPVRKQRVRVEEAPKPVARKIELRPTKSAWGPVKVAKVEPIKVQPVQPVKAKPVNWARAVAEVEVTKPKRKSGWDVKPDGTKAAPPAPPTPVRKSGWDVQPDGKVVKPIKPATVTVQPRKSGWDVQPDGKVVKPVVKPVVVEPVKVKPTSWARVVVKEVVVEEVESESEESEDEYDLSLLVAHKKR